MFSTPDFELQVEQNEKLIVVSLEISVDKQDMKKGKKKDKELFLLQHRYINNIQASSYRTKRVDK
jgi:hypothetical protein